jgi:hypothetical protein
METRPSVRRHFPICAGRHAAEAQLAELGISRDKPIDDQLDALDPPLAFDNMEQTFRSMLDDHRHSLEAIIDEPVAFELAIVGIEVDDYWSYWVDGTGRQFRLRLNRERASFSRSEASSSPSTSCSRTAGR